MPRLLVIGLDCVPPELAFDRMARVMPNFSALRARGLSGPLRSTHPPITVPAWVTMTSGADPGELGLYGFRNRVPDSYDLRVVTAEDCERPRIWDILENCGKKCVSAFVPLTWPPPRHDSRTELVSCFLTPTLDEPWTNPVGLSSELFERFGPYEMDVEDFRTGPSPQLFERIVSLTSQHFEMGMHLWKTRKPDFMMMVTIGPDRFHHAFWNRLDEYGENYYSLLDRHIGQWLEHVDPDTHVMVVSDHGARTMLGAVAINQWLWEQGWLVLKEPPSNVARLDECNVDWDKTRAWSEGGYYARLFLNVRGREPRGAIPVEKYNAVRDELSRSIAQIPHPKTGAPLGNVIHYPENLFRDVRGMAPDALVFFGDLAYRSIGTLGHESWLVTKNDRGEDSCNHDWDGIFVLTGPRVTHAAARHDLRIENVAKTMLDVMGAQPTAQAIPGESFLAEV